MHLKSVDHCNVCVIITDVPSVQIWCSTKKTRHVLQKVNWQVCSWYLINMELGYALYHKNMDLTTTTYRTQASSSDGWSILRGRYTVLYSPLSNLISPLLMICISHLVAVKRRSGGTALDEFLHKRMLSTMPSNVNTRNNANTNAGMSLF